MSNANDPILVKHEPPLGWLIINRPQVKNALNYEAWRAIVTAVDELNGNPEVRVIVMRGATADSFISGADISEFPSHRANAEQARAYRDAPGNATGALVNSPKPVVAMIAGICIGGGLQVALSCDVRIAARGTRMGIPAARLGLAYPLDGVLSLSQIAGPANARDILMSARIFDAEEAYAMGLLNQLVDPGELEAVVRNYATRMAGNAPLTMSAAKATIREGLKDAVNRDMKKIGAMVAQCFDSEDYREGVRAFLEKRPPKFHGR
ncbi:MAG: enoyl-CoA hydratase/isomerase family protein [Candidatus Binataceae bacterium]|nr:enoyl-CoA hydratase/isomerase family protein [Candidatus Binataceae bacterium]